MSKRYRIGEVDVTALDGINLHVDEAAFVAIVGPSGCGKTTLLNMIGALDIPTSGSVRVGGVDVSGASRADRAVLRRHTVSFIFQTFNLFPGLTAFENVQFGADASQRPRSTRSWHGSVRRQDLRVRTASPEAMTKTATNANIRTTMTDAAVGTVEMFGSQSDRVSTQ